MKTYVLIYEDFAHFEVILASYLLKTKGEIITVGINKDVVISTEGYKIVPDIIIDNVVINDVDVLIIPGGDPNKLYEYDGVYKLISKIYEKNKIIGAVCVGPIHLAKASVLNGKKYTTSLDVSEYNEFDSSKYVDENVVVDGNIITAKASGYVDFAIEMGKVMDIYEDENDLMETIQFFKYFKS